MQSVKMVCAWGGTDKESRTLLMRDMQILPGSGSTDDDRSPHGTKNSILPAADLWAVEQKSWFIPGGFTRLLLKQRMQMSLKTVLRRQRSRILQTIYPHKEKKSSRKRGIFCFLHRFFARERARRLHHDNGRCQWRKRLPDCEKTKKSQKKDVFRIFLLQ